MHPQELKIIIWQIIMIICLGFIIIFIPVRVSFELKYTWIPILYQILSGLIIIDICIKFNLGFYHEGQVVTKRMDIVK